jgi:glycosyltransferase involved in cell wall biosynthesis
MQSENSTLAKDTRTVNCESLPYLLYFGEVPVENYMHGSTLLYRLLSSYPKEKLTIIEGGGISSPDRRLRGVSYCQCKPMLSRLSRTRFRNYVSPYITLCAPLQRNYLTKLLRNFQPEAVITVVWGYTWATAAAYAERARLPLHLIVHDDSPNAEGWGAMERRVIHARLSHWYPKAASRLCVSPYTAAEYRRRYNAMGDVLYPSRATDTPVFTEPPDSLGQRCQPFTVAFAGTIYPLYADGLRRIAAALRATCAGRLLVYGPTPSESVRSLLQEPNIELRGRVSAAELIRQCRQEAHAMFVPMTYQDEHRPSVEIAFPSKLADCTAMGLPLVIDGPEYCTAVRWARENPGVAEVVTNQTADSMADSVARLQDPAHRLRLAKAAIHRGAQYFAPERAICTLYSKLRNVSRNSNNLTECERMGGRAHSYE